MDNEDRFEREGTLHLTKIGPESTFQESSPQKLFGRKDEINRLLDAYDDSKSSSSNDDTVVLISGPPGVGKTALANVLRPHVIKDDGLFLSGKFELTQAQDPYAIFVALLASFTDSVVDTSKCNVEDNRLNLIQESIQLEVGQEGGLLVELFPPIARIVGKQEKTGSVTGCEARHRLHFVFCQFIRAVSAICPVVLFIDDIQWGDRASLDLLQAILQGRHQPFSCPNTNLLCVLTIRKPDEKRFTTFSEPHNSHPCYSFLDGVKSNSGFTEIWLQNFNESKLNDFMSAILKSPAESTRSLTQMVYPRSNGNIFVSLQILRQLEEDLSLTFDDYENCWVWRTDDSSQVSSMESDDDILGVSFQHQLSKLSFFTREVLQVAACMGDVLDEVALTIVQDDQACEVAQSIQVATQERFLVLTQQSGLYRFAHDRIRQAVLLTIHDVDEFSFQIGYKLMTQSSASLLDTIIFLVVKLINHGVSKMHERNERYHASRLNLEAGQKAVSSAAFPDAFRCFEAGIEFLKGGAYWAEEYELSLDLFNSAADAALCCQDFMKVTEYVNEIFANARSEKDKIRAYVVQIHAVGQHKRVHEAMDLGLVVLERLGESLPARASQLTIMWAIIKTQVRLKGRSSDAMLASALIDDELKHGAIHVLCVLIPYTFQAGSSLTVLVGTKLIQLCLKFGMCKECSLGFVTLSWLICKTDKREGYRIGLIGLSIVEKLGARELIPRTHIVFYFFTNHWIRRVGDSLDPLQNAYKIAMEIGDIEYAMYAARFRCVLAFFSGMALPRVQTLVEEAQSQMKLYKQENILEVMNQLHQFILNVTSNANDDPKSFGGEELQSGNVSSILLRLSLSTMLAHLFGDFDLAERLAHDRQDLKRVHFAIYTASVDTLLEGVIAVGQARRGIRRQRNIKVAKRCLQKLRAMSKNCPENFLNKQTLLEAELFSLSSRKAVVTKTNELYGRAYEIAQQQGFTYEAAMACELAGDFMHLYNNESLKKEYWEQAYSLYVDWGADTKARHFRSRIDAMS